MTTYIYDWEVFRYDWLVVFLDLSSGEFMICHNDAEALLNWMDPDALYIGFNSKAYDQWITKAACSGWENEDIKDLSDYLIKGGNGWEHPDADQMRYWFNNVDIMDDMQQGLSLKAIEGHMGMSIEETEVDFNLDRPLTPQELDETIKYCKHDVEATAKLVQTRRSYLTTKISVGKMAGIPEAKALSMTNAKLTAAFLGARKPPVPWKDEREYKYPENLKREYIPQEVFDFFDRMKDPTVSDEVLFKSKLDITVGSCPTVLAYGGIHGAIPCYREKETETRIIRNYDVGSYYPHLMTVCGYTSRNIPDPKVYADMLEKRMAAKKAGDKVTANALKLVANTTYGAMLNRYNDLYDPLMGRSVCVSGQLYLLELAEKLIAECPTLRPVQLNTDGIMVSFDRSEYDTVLKWTQEWQDRTGFTLEEDRVLEIVQKDVNNYVETAEDGTVKIKGGYLVRGIAPAGAFNVNNNAVIVAEAIKEYFVNGTPPEDTILACEDVSKFQQIAKAGAKYREAYHEVDGEELPVQKVNRVYAAKDPRYGRIFKVKTENEMVAKIEMLPEHCLIDNVGTVTIDQIDKQFYVDMARKRINDFLGIKPEKKGKKNMAAAKTQTPQQTPMTALQKLLKARVKFLESGAKKSGMNSDIEFLYFELKDIVPVATGIFSEVGLVPVVWMDREMAYMEMFNTEDEKDKVTFSIPLAQWTGNRAVNPIQVIGATVTYYRRYLYQIALDIVEADEIDNKPQSVLTDTAPAAEAPRPPATTEERKEIKKELTGADGPADDLMITQLKRTAKALKDLASGTDRKDEIEEFLGKLAVATKGFKEISKAACAKVLTKIAGMMEEFQN